METNLDLRKLGIRIQQYRLERKLTQEELANRIGSTQVYISDLENGHYSPQFNTIYSIAKTLNVSLDSLVADYDDSTGASTLKLFLDEIKGMNSKQLKILKDQIELIKKHN